MKAKISKAQLEVWEWKERAFEELKKIPEKERVDYIMKKVKKTIDEIKKNKKKSLV